MRSDPIAHQRQGSRARTASAAERDAAELIAELAIAGLVSIEVADDGDVSYALTAQGRQSARLMAMSRDAHAVVLLGALLGLGGGLN